MGDNSPWGLKEWDMTEWLSTQHAMLAEGFTQYMCACNRCAGNTGYFLS